MINKTLKEFFNEVNSDAPTPGGGAVVAYIGALSLGLSNMATYVSKKKKSFLALDDKVQKQVEQSLKSLDEKANLLLVEINKDIQGFASYMDALRLPKNNEEELKIRETKLNQATNENILLPFHVLEILLESVDEIEVITPYITPSIISDLAISIILLDALIESSIVNLKINLKYVKDEAIINKVNSLINQAHTMQINKLNLLKTKVIEKLN